MIPSSPPQGVGLPSDLGGMTFAHYSIESNDNLEATLGPACTRIKNAIAKSGRLSTGVQPLETLPTRDSSDFVPRPRRRNSLGTASSSGPTTEMRIVNISVSGAFLATAGELPVDKVLDLELRLDDGTDVSLTARVVRVQYPAWERIGGVGVKFTSVAENSARALEAFVAGNHPAPSPADLRAGLLSTPATR